MPTSAATPGAAPTGWRAWWARASYSALLRALTPLYLLRLWRRGRAEPLYRARWPERFGFYAGPALAAPDKTAPRVWLHAVSLGETRAAAALVAALRAQRPGLQLVLTHGTATGREAGLELLQAGDVQTWLPYDTPGAVRRFLRHHQPSLGVLMETEIWPNLLHHAAKRGLPLILANARLSERSARKGERFGALLRPAAQCLSLALAQTQADAERLLAAGVRDVAVAGNLKFELMPDAQLLAQAQAWREAVLPAREAAGLAASVVLAAVTREGEEAELLQDWSQLPAPRPLLVLVPRHPQRFDEVAQLCLNRGFTVARRSQWQTPQADEALADVWLGDSMREMPLYYGLADVALLGGSFAPLGGQNLIEAAACGCPLVMGPHTFNFSEAAELAEEAGAAWREPDLKRAVETALALCRDSQQRATASAAGRAFAAQHQGAAQRMAARILALL